MGWQTVPDGCTKEREKPHSPNVILVCGRTYITYCVGRISQYLLPAAGAVDVQSVRRQRVVWLPRLTIRRVDSAIGYS